MVREKGETTFIVMGMIWQTNYTLRDKKRSKDVILTNDLVLISKGYEMVHPYRV